MISLEYFIDTGQPHNINWSASDEQRIIQNVQNLINTWKYEVAYNRVMGMDPTLLDQPLDIAVAMYTSEVFRLVSDYEPRAKVTEVGFSGIDDDGNMQFKVVLEI